MSRVQSLNFSTTPTWGKPHDAKCELRSAVAAVRNMFKGALIGDLARSLHDHGRLAEAQPLLLEVLEGQHRSIGNSYPGALTATATTLRC